MKRLEVYDLIDGERAYQRARHEGHCVPHKDEDHSVADWILYMEDQLNQAKKHIYNLDESLALDQIRKVTALGVACMENKETKPRG